MSKHTKTVHCGQPECEETGFFAYDSAKELRQSYISNRQWMCVRHSSPDEVLSVDRPTISTELTSVQKSHGLYWGDSSGFMHGPGFKAFAKDFPPGTILRVTAEVILSKETL